MAAVTVDSQEQPIIIGNVRLWIGQVDIAADGDTLVVPGFSKVLFAVAQAPNDATPVAVGCSWSGDTVTFRAAAAESNVKVMAIGW